MISVTVHSQVLQRNMKKLLRNIDIDLSKEINNSAGIVVKDIKERVAKGIDVNDAPFEPLKEITIKKKIQAKYKRPNAPLIATGKMSGALSGKQGGAYLKRRATARNQMAIVSAPTKRAEYGKYHMAGNSNLPVRKWFGVSRDASEKIARAMNLKIRRIISRAD